jgi:hypothetical protein
MKAIAKKTYMSPEVVAFNMKVRSILMNSTLDPSGDTPSVEVSGDEHHGGFGAREYDFDEDEY